MNSQIFCKNEQARRAILLKRPGLNGIDYLEVDAADHRVLYLFFVKPVGPANPLNPNDPDDEYGLSKDPSKITISGGVRIVGIHVISCTRSPAGFLEVHVDHAGDFSTYTLAIQVSALDRVLADVDFFFMAACPVDFDCRTVTECPPPALSEPVLDYLAKDYASFRKLLLDLLPTLNSQFTERNAADLGITLVELLAYHGDRLSYFQDAVANEAYLDTLRQRISARRHARLIDYHMHDGHNAWTYVHLAVSAPTVLPQGTMLLSHITAALEGDSAPPPAAMNATQITIEALEGDPALQSVLVFESTFPAQLDALNNEIFLHTWGNEECCLQAGTTDAFLYAVQGTTAVQPALKKGDYLLLEEVRGPLTGLAADFSMSHRQVVLIDDDPQSTDDPLFSSTLVNGAPKPWQTGDPTLPLLHVHWRKEDALAFPLCLSSRPTNVGLIRNVSVARGNIVLANHGVTVSEILTRTVPVPEDADFRLQLAHGPLTMEPQPSTAVYDEVTGRLATLRHTLAGDARDARPTISLTATFPTGEELWTPVPDLLNSLPFDQCR